MKQMVSFSSHIAFPTVATSPVSEGQMAQSNAQTTGNHFTLGKSFTLSFPNHEA